MKRIKTIIAISLFLCINVNVTGQVIVNNIEVKRNGNKAEISFNAQINKKATKQDYKLIMTPVIHNGRQSAELSPIVVESRRTRIMDAREGVPPIPNALLTQNGRTEYYTTTIEYKEWMTGANIRLDGVAIGCCNERELPPVVVAKDLVTTKPDEVVSVYVEPDKTQPSTAPVVAPAVTERAFSGAIMILEKNTFLQAPLVQVSGQSVIQAAHLEKFTAVFRQADSRLDLYMGDNYRVMSDLIAALRTSDRTLERIEITGHASPEGTQTGNYTLSQNRALAVRNYILNHVDYLRPSNFDIVSGGENWRGLYKLVEASNMPSRRQVLDIIERVPDTGYGGSNVRKKMLMEVDGGRAWRYMYARFFPQLRNASVSVTIYYKATVAKGETERIATGASGYDSEFVQNTEQINRAIDLLGERNSTGALEILVQLENDPRAWNPMGVCYLLRGDVAKAKEYFQKAIEAGCNEAKGNLEQLR